jgi:hypothetical protein
MMNTPAQAGFEAGIMRRMPAHPNMHQSTPARQFMEGFKRGRERRAWLDARGQKRVEHIVVKSGPGDWHWELLVEKQIYAQGWSRTEKAASQACEDANMARVAA